MQVWQPSPETQALMQEVDALCTAYGIENNVKIKALDIVTGRFIGKVKMKVELRMCLAWMIDHDKTTLTTMRLINWFEHTLQFQRRDERLAKEVRYNPGEVGLHQLRKDALDCE